MPLVASADITITDVNDGLSIVLSLETFTLVTDQAGLGGSYAGASTTLGVFLGTTDDSANWVFTAALSEGVLGVLVGRVFTLSALNADAGYVDFTATRPGQATLNRRFNVLKQKQGITGPSITVTANSPGFTFTDGVASPSNQVITLTALRNRTSPATLWFASNGAPLETDVGVVTPEGWAFGLPMTGVGDRCYVPLAVLGAADQMYVTAVSGDTTGVYQISRINTYTAQPGATRNAYLVVSVGVAVWSDATANQVVLATWGVLPRPGDVVTQSNPGVGYNEARIWTGTVWDPLAAFFPGNVLVLGSITGNLIGTAEVDSLQLAGQAVTFPQYAEVTTNTDMVVTDQGNWVTLISDTFDYPGDNVPVLITGNVSTVFVKTTGVDMTIWCKVDCKVRYRNLTTAGAWTEPVGFIDVLVGRALANLHMPVQKQEAAAGTWEVEIVIKPNSVSSWTDSYLRAIHPSIVFMVLKR